MHVCRAKGSFSFVAEQDAGHLEMKMAILRQPKGDPWPFWPFVWEGVCCFAGSTLVSWKWKWYSLCTWASLCRSLTHRGQFYQQLTYGLASRIFEAPKSQ